MILRLICLFVLAITGSQSVLAQETVISPKDAEKIRDVEIAGITLGTTLENIAYGLSENNYKSICSRNGCQFSKYGGIANISINFPQKALRTDRAEVIQYGTKNSTKVCKDALDVMCPMSFENTPCVTKENLVILRTKSLDPSEDGWQYSLSVFMDTAAKKCEIRASQRKIK